MDLNMFCRSASPWFIIAVLVVLFFAIIGFRDVVLGFYPQPLPPVPAKTEKKARPSKRQRKRLAEEKAKSEDSLVDELQSKKNGAINPNMKTLRVFSYQSLVDATQNFSESLLMNRDMAGRVYRGKLRDTNEDLAIRRLGWTDEMTFEEFKQETALLSQANHPNLANMIGYCFKPGNRFWVYEFVPGVSLETLLYGNEKILEWKIRVKIIAGIANALNYLQDVMKPPVLHCYLEPSNIWIDREFVPKLSAFGMIKMFPPPRNSGLKVSYPMLGSYNFASIDLTPFEKSTVKTDSYGFGILLLEIISGKKVSFFDENGELKLLNDLVLPYVKKERSLLEIVDPRLKKRFDKDDLLEVCCIAEMCLQKDPNRRPFVAAFVERMNRIAN